MLTSDKSDLQSRLDSAFSVPEEVQNRFTDSHLSRPLLQKGSLSNPHRRLAGGVTEVASPSAEETKYRQAKRASMKDLNTIVSRLKV